MVRRGEIMARPPIRIYTRSWCEDSQAAKEFLQKLHLTFEEVDIEQEPEAATFVERVNQGKRRTPTFDAGGRPFACSPFDEQKLRRELGLPE
jgi:mycoredoxin